MRGRAYDDHWVACLLLLGTAVGLWATFGWIAFAVLGAIALLCLAVLWSTELRRECKHGRRLYGVLGARVCPDCQEQHAREAEEHAREAAAQQRRRAEERGQAARRAFKYIRDLSHLNSLDPFKFEELVLLTYKRLGWNVQGTPRSGDHGVDGILKKDSQVVVLQCKRLQSGKVGPGVLRDLLGTVTKEGATNGVLVTTSDLSSAAMAWIRDVPQITHVNGPMLVSMIKDAFPDRSSVPVEFGFVQESEEQDAVCPRCGRPVRLVTWRHGEFLGCTGYPGCRWTESVGLRSKRRRRFRRRAS